MTIKIYKSVNEIPQSETKSGCSSFVRKHIAAIKGSGFILLADLTRAYAKEASRSIKEVGPQVRQTASRIGRLETQETPAGKRTLVYKK